MTVNLENIQKVHFIGITSAFNSFCASYLISIGKTVTASQHNQNSEDANYWLNQGILYPGGHSGNFIEDDIDLVVYPNAPYPDNPECIKTEELGLDHITIGQLTGIVLSNFKTIAVAGTHGKTTTSALITWIFYANGIEPNFILGGTDGKIAQINTNWNFNPTCEYVVVEACEYKEQFLDRAPNPFISVITNIELDHTDFFPDAAAYNSAFVKFLKNTHGSIVIDIFGKNESLVLDQVLKHNSTVDIYDVAAYRVLVPDFKSILFGNHNRQNMRRAYIAGEILGYSAEEIAHAFETFPGLGERFEFVGTMDNGALVYKDYAHNPKKVSSCLQGAREAYPDKSILFVFQPHSYERTYSFMDEFTNSMNDADEIMISNIFAPSREPEEFLSLTSPEELVAKLKEKNPGKNIHHSHGIENVPELVKELANENTVVIFATAGNLFEVIPQLF